MQARSCNVAEWYAKRHARSCSALRSAVEDMDIWEMGVRRAWAWAWAGNGASHFCLIEGEAADAHSHFTVHHEC